MLLLMMKRIIDWPRSSLHTGLGAVKLGDAASHDPGTHTWPVRDHDFVQVDVVDLHGRPQIHETFRVRVYPGSTFKVVDQGRIRDDLSRSRFPPRPEWFLTDDACLDGHELGARFGQRQLLQRRTFD